MTLLFNLFPSPLVLVGAIAIVVLAGIVQRSLGMGFGTIAAPLIALLDPALVPFPVLLLGFGSALAGTVSERHNVVWPEAALVSFGRMIGATLAVGILLLLPDQASFLIVFGGGILFALALSAAGLNFRATPYSLSAAGFVSGTMGTITSVGAPPLAIVYQNADPQGARPTLAAIFMLGCAISMLWLTLSGWGGWREVAQGLTLFPFMLLGVYLARFTTPGVARRFRPALWAISAFAAVILILRGIGWM